MTKTKPDFIFMFETSPIMQCLLGVWLKKKYARHGLTVPLYAYIQDLWPENLEMVTGIHSPVLISPFAALTAYIYRNCDEIFATSPSFVEEIKKRTPRKDHVHYWPQYAEDFYHPMPRSCHPEISDNEKALRIFFTGNIGFAQGLDILPKTAAILKEHGCSVRFYIVGDGRYKSIFIDQVSTLQDYFVFLDRRPAEDIPKLLAWADAAFFSFMENDLFTKTIPAKLQSYMACGLPIIASAMGESARIITEAKCGLCSPLGDASALAQTIIQFSNIPLSARQQMGNRSRDYFLAHFEKQKLLNEFQPWFSKLPPEGS